MDESPQPLEKMARRVNSVRGKRMRSDLDINAAIVGACKYGRRNRPDIMLSASLTARQAEVHLIGLMAKGFIERDKKDGERSYYYTVTDRGIDFLKSMKVILQQNRPDKLPSKTVKSFANIVFKVFIISFPYAAAYPQISAASFSSYYFTQKSLTSQTCYNFIR